MDAADQQALTGAVIREHGLDMGQLWLEHLAIGGDASEEEIRDYSAGLATLPPKDRDTLAQAVNEHCAAAGLLSRAPFSDSLLALARSDSQEPYSSK
ncbi:hypothetical protein C3B78_01705 [Arthrobacter sp. PGP41]|uniref:hypothetical protein n=1 Tax=unclassified Arthrobacter TaxID=235627 RepID=UPI000CDC1D57|nr:MULTISPECIES: hypothetical protein [unclassified Arthrobacter]AUZ33322.1 hypothetical protein C3B78_01705 [Arthrobacter sp. PGP41]MDT0194768.1 hypothetical protein [Arthrobacter sp. AB6]